MNHDIPVAYLVGYARPVGVNRSEGEPVGGGPPAHYANKVQYSGSLANGWVWAPGYLFSEPRALLAFAGHFAAMVTGQSGNATAELDEGTYEFQPDTLTVNGIEHEGLTVRKHGIKAWAVAVEGGWTVLASVPEDSDKPEVELVPVHEARSGAMKP